MIPLTDYQAITFGIPAVFAAALLCFVSIAFGIALLVKRRRHRIAKERFQEALDTGPILLLQAHIDRFTSKNIRVTKYGDRRYRDGAFSPKLAFQLAIDGQLFSGEPPRRPRIGTIGQYQTSFDPVWT